MDILIDFPDILDEAQYVYVVRNQKKRKKLAPREGYKIVNGKYIKMKLAEKRNRSRGVKKGLKKRRVKTSEASRKRRISMAKREAFGLSRR